jgi:tungstate transport system ATP-binding protein
MMFPLRIDGLAYRPGGTPVLDGIDLVLGAEGISVVLGANGAGKSVLLRSLCGLLRPDAGRIDWGGQTQPDGHIAMVFQQPMVLRASLADNVAVALKPLGLSVAQRRQRALAALDRVGLAGRAGEAARRLSGGEKQRLALARAWVREPALLLLDEPTASLDPSATDAVERIIREIRTEGTRILMTTHNLAQASRLADEIIFIAGGRVREHTAAARFFSRPASAEAQHFIKGELPWSFAFSV